MNTCRAVVVTLLCVAVLAACDSGTPRRPTVTVSPTASPSDAAAARTARATAGLTKILAAHPLQPGQTSTALTSCPLGSLKKVSTKLDRTAHGDTANYAGTRYAVQRYADFGDRGLAVACTRRTGDDVVLGLIASSHTKAITVVPDAKHVKSFTYRDGRLFVQTGSRQCSVYFTPRDPGYVLALVYRTGKPTVDVCRRGFDAVATPVIATLGASA